MIPKIIENIIISKYKSKSSLNLDLLSIFRIICLHSFFILI